jgi:Transposase and inactivated derivatives, IS30 family
LRKDLIACLRHGRAKRRPRSRGQDRRGQISDMLSLHVRPPEVEDRLVPGHWEGDLIKGARNQSAVGTLVERTSRLVLLARMEGATAEAALAGFTCILNRVHMPMRKTLTYDQGKEMSRHQDLTAVTGVPSISPIRIAPGSAAPTRTPTACCATICPRAPTCQV